MGDQVRAGTIGTSWYADRMHLPNLKSHDGAHIAAICGRNRAWAQGWRTSMPAGRICASFAR